MDTQTQTNASGNAQGLNQEVQAEKAEKAEKLKYKAFSILDFFIGALLFGLFLGVVVVFANGTINLITKWFPSLKKPKKEV
jgi:F0F1-type ATP synthase assembly protein I